jgi:predicted nucleic acid-binding protein
LRLDDLRPATAVFIDANIFIYHFTGASADMRISVRGLSDEILTASQRVRHEHGLLVGDSLLLATMRAEGIRTLASRDGDMRRITQIEVASPADV